MKFKAFYITEMSLEQFHFKGWKDYQKRVPMIKHGVDILKKLEKSGKAYIVGGAVRDIITGEKVPNDIDIATNVKPEIIEKIFGKENFIDIGKNKDFGISVLKYKGDTYEIAQFRGDLYVKPKTVRKILQ